jgi:hypothetical protein
VQTMSIPHVVYDLIKDGLVEKVEKWIIYHLKNL